MSRTRHEPHVKRLGDDRPRATPSPPRSAGDRLGLSPRRRAERGADRPAPAWACSRPIPTRAAVSRSPGPRPDGSRPSRTRMARWACRRPCTNPGWATPYAVAALGGPGTGPGGTRPGRTLALERAGHTAPRASNPCAAHDTSIAGWPWVAETHSWLEPTALTAPGPASRGAFRTPEGPRGLATDPRPRDRGRGLELREQGRASAASSGPSRRRPAWPCWPWPAWTVARRSSSGPSPICEDPARGPLGPVPRLGAARPEGLG